MMIWGTLILIRPEAGEALQSVLREAGFLPPAFTMMPVVALLFRDEVLGYAVLYDAFSPDKGEVMVYPGSSHDGVVSLFRKFGRGETRVVMSPKVVRTVRTMLRGKKNGEQGDKKSWA